MKFLKWLGILVAAAVVAILSLVAVARFSDGPLGPLAGGPFESGEPFAGSEPDWGFLRDRATVEFQLLDPPRSRTTWILEHAGNIYIPSGYMDSAIGGLWKQWPHEAERDGRAVLRVDSVLYERQLVRLQPGAEVIPALGAELLRKYPEAFGSSADVTPEAASASVRERVASGSLWLFRVAPPPKP